MLCFLYVIALTATLGMIAALLEPVLPARAPRRWLWLAAIALTMTIPAFYRAQHSVAVPTGWGMLSAHDPLLIQIWNKVSLGLLLWSAGSVLLVAYAVWRARRARGGAAIVDGVPVVLHERLGPATTGFWRSHVLLPRWVLGLPEPQRQYIVQHEEQHRRAHDARVLFLASLTLIVIPWNVSLWWLLRRLALAIEMDCDHRVVAALGNERRYGELLVDVAARGGRGPRLQPGFIGGSGMLERRLRNLIAPVMLSRTVRYAFVSVAIVLLLIALTVPHPINGAH